METDNSLTTRFFTKVEQAPSGCWEWIASKTADGYGQFRYPTSTSSVKRAHRASYDYFYGGIPEGKQVNHHCDNPGCVNPAHLYAGTQQENVDDLMARGRHRGTTPRATCNKGHERSTENTLVNEKTGMRSCRVCRVDYKNKNNEKIRAQDRKRYHAKKTATKQGDNNE